jgi:hypothetical protein
VWIDGYDVKGETFFNLIFCPADGAIWMARHALTSSAYQRMLDDFTQQGFRLVHIESYMSSGVRYAAIFVKSSGLPFTAYHGRTVDDHQQLFDELTADGWLPINISVVSVAGTRTYAALYEKREVGSFFAQSFLTSAEYQRAVDDNFALGRHLIYLNAYTHLGSPRHVAIWHQQATLPRVAQHGLSGSQYQAAYDKQIRNGFITRAVTGYEESGSHRFAACWAKP